MTTWKTIGLSGVVVIVAIGVLFLVLRNSSIPDFTAYELSKPLSFSPNLTKIELLVKNGVPNNDVVYAQIVNNSNTDIFADSLFTLEFFDGEYWRITSLRESFAFTADFVIIEAGETFYTRYFLNMFYPLPNVDLFRIRQSVNYYSSSYPHDLLLEFTR